VTVLFGDNGEGKTNIIEAVYFLATLRSFRTSEASDLLQQGAGQARVAADVSKGGLDRRVAVKIEPGRRIVTLDGKAVRGAAALFGGFNAVVFVPEDLRLPRGAPAARRRFLDLAVFGVERGYYREAAAFQRVLKSRNALLRAGEPEAALLDAYDEELARTGARVTVRRRALASALAPRVAEAFRSIAGSVPAAIRYRSDPAVEAAREEPAVNVALHDGLRARRALDVRRRRTTFGPQTDDLDVLLDGRLAREHASQGQIRSLVLALKLAELSHLEECLGEPPVLLLDDVAGELDPARREYLFAMIETLSCQTMVSVTDRSLLPAFADHEYFQVAKGQLRPVT